MEIKKNAASSGSSSSGITIGTTTITGGADTQVLFNDGGVVGSDAGFTYVKATDTLTAVGALNLGGDTTAFPAFQWNTTQTVDNLLLAVGTTSRAFVIVENGDTGFDFAHAQQTNPTLFIHSAAQNTAQWSSISHNGTNGVIGVGAGVLTVAQPTTTVTFPAFTTTLAGLNVFQTFTQDQVISSDIFLLFGTQTGFIWRTIDTPDTLKLLTSTTSNAVVMCEYGDHGFDFAHALQTNPTLFIHSANQSTTQWMGFTHDATNGVISVGTGKVSVPSGIYTFAATTADATADSIFGASAAGAKALVVQGKASPTQPIFQVQVSTGTSCFQVQTDGGVIIDQRSGATFSNPLDVKYIGTTVFTASFAGDATAFRDFVFNAAATGRLSWGGVNVLTSGGSNRLQVGEVNGASPTSQTIQSQGSRGGTDTNVGGGNFTIRPGVGTGTGTPSDLVIQTYVPTTSGTTAQTSGDRQRILGKYTTLTEGTAASFVQVSVATSAVVGGVIEYTVESNDGTDYQALTESASYVIVNKAGTLTMSLATYATAVASSSAATLTGTLTLLDATAGNAQFNMNATSGLAQTTLRINAQIRKNFGTGTIAAI